jgi:Arc/MetJ-type ribon-helix-helix transcriptional regulator
MTVTLKPEQEQVVGEAIRAGLIGTADEVIDAGIEAIRQRLESSTSFGNTRSRQQQIDAAAERLLKFGEKYHFSLGDITIKDLVNEGRR